MKQIAPVALALPNKIKLYLNRPDPIDFMSVTVDTSGRIYDDLSRLLFLHDHRDTSVLVNELPDESDQFRFLHVYICIHFSSCFFYYY